MTGITFFTLPVQNFSSQIVPNAVEVSLIEKNFADRSLKGNVVYVPDHIGPAISVMQIFVERYYINRANLMSYKHDRKKKPQKESNNEWRNILTI